MEKDPHEKKRKDKTKNIQKYNSNDSYHIYVVSNRYMYKRSVLQFDEHKYVTVVERLNTEINSFDGLLYA